MKNQKLNRRHFLRNSSAGALGAGIFGGFGLKPSAGDPGDEPPRIKGYKILGRTGFRASDICMGVCFSDSIYRAGLNAGINIIETSEMYSQGNEEKSLGRIMKDFKREELFLLTKITPKNKWNTADEVIARAEASMKRLQTDYLDCYMIHGATSSEMAGNEAFHEAVDQMQIKGSIRFRGISCHGHSWWDNPDESYEQVLMNAIDDGRFDVVMLPYNYIESETGDRVIAEAGKKNIGILAMKSNPVYLFEYLDELKKEREAEGDSLNERYTLIWEKFKKQTEESKSFFRKYDYESLEELNEGAIQFVLSNPGVHSICMFFKDLAGFDKYIRLSGTRLDDRKQAMLNDFRELYGPLQCRIGCNRCEAACPHHIPVNTIMRYNYYFHGKKREKYAMQQYADLQIPGPEVCHNCQGYCQEACPHGVLVKGLLSLAHQSLAFNHNPAV